MAFELDLNRAGGVLPSSIDVVLQSPGHNQRDRREAEAGHAIERRWPRLAVDIQVHVRIKTLGPTRIVACEGHGTDISGGGLAVTAELDLAEGAQIAVEFTPPYSDEPINFRCFIRNRDGNRYGLEFMTENDEDYRKAGELQHGLAAMKAGEAPS